MATHNGERFIKAQIDSILVQLSIDDELVISDDGSSDDTVKIVKAYNDPRFRLLQSKRFNHPSKNFEYALMHCKNNVIFLADQDDVWHPDKIKIMTKEVIDCDLVICDCRLVDEGLKTIHPSFFKLNGAKKGLVRNFYRSSFVGCCMAFRKRILEKAVPFPDELVFHDQWIGLIAQKYFNVKFIPQVLVDYRRHSKSYSTTGGMSKNSLSKKVISRVKLAELLLKR